jgi:hypothetical protein
MGRQNVRSNGSTARSEISWIDPDFSALDSDADSTSSDGERSVLAMQKQLCEMCWVSLVRAKGMCNRCYQAKWRKEHTGRSREISLVSYDRHREDRLAYMRWYRETHCEEIASRARRSEQREKSRGYERAYREAHREEIKA